MPGWDAARMWGDGESQTFLGSHPIAWAARPDDPLPAVWLAASVLGLNPPPPHEHRASLQHSLAMADGDWSTRRRFPESRSSDRNRSESKASEIWPDLNGDGVAGGGTRSGSKKGE